MNQVAKSKNRGQMPRYVTNNEKTFQRLFKPSKIVFHFLRKIIKIWDLPSKDENVVDYFQSQGSFHGRKSVLSTGTKSLFKNRQTMED